MGKKLEYSDTKQWRCASALQTYGGQEGGAGGEGGNMLEYSDTKQWRCASSLHTYGR